MAKQTIYTVGGTVQAGGGVYIKRGADDELLDLCKQGEFAFILSSRQVGKSSLMVHTAQTLAADDICSVIIDLSSLGTSITQDEWYLGILSEIQNSLNLETDIFKWWEEYNQLGTSQRLTNFFKDVLLKEVKEQVVLFFDEIDSTLSIPFSDDFYVALRAVYNARSITPDFKRLSFVLVGVAAPSDLISDNRRTPFNIGHRVEIKDFTSTEALPLAQGLGQQAEKVLAWVLQYTGGHPYLTQRLSADLANSKQAIDEQIVASTVERLFTGEQGKLDNNLQFVRDMLSKRSPDVTKVLLIYKDIRSGKKVLDDERSITKAHLKLSGLVRSENGILRLRNKIYNTVFNPQWIQENTPKNWQKVALIALGSTLAFIVLATLVGVAINLSVDSRVTRATNDFISTTSPSQRLSDLAEIYSAKGFLSDKDYSQTASQLFYSFLSTKEDQLSLFTDDAIDSNAKLQYSLMTVIESFYITVADVNLADDNTQLLKTMRDSLAKVTNNEDAAEALQVKNEITSWLDGRDKYHMENYQEALTHYNNAINLNPSNPATIYERARVYIALKQYDNALLDLDNTIKIVKAKQSTTQEEKPSLTTTITTTLPVIETLTQALPATQNSSVMATPDLPSIQPSVPVAVSPQKNKFESTFSTYIEIVNAVKTLIGNDPILQDTIQGSSENTYVSLKDFFSTSTPTLAVLESQSTFTSLPATDTLVPVQQVSSSATATPEFVQYVVQPGDSLVSIATRFGVDINVVAQINNLSDANFLFVGQVLKIPTTSIALTAILEIPNQPTFVPASSFSATPVVTTAIKPTSTDSQATAIDFVPTAIFFPPTATNVPPATSFQAGSFPAEVNMRFSPISIPSGGTSLLSITIFNPNPFQLTNASWMDNLPTGIPAVGVTGNSCGGTVNAATGSNTISLSGGSVPAQSGSTPGSCTVSIKVTSTTLGSLINTIPTGAFSSAGGGTNITNTNPASATLNISSSP